MLLAAGGGAAATAGLMAFGDDVKYTYEAVERTGRVATALAVCVNDYRKTLNAREKIEDPEEKQRLLRECHQRCADRTLEVLEKSGGIFIKLGQHLVWHPRKRVVWYGMGDMLTDDKTERHELPPPARMDNNLHPPPR